MFFAKNSKTLLFLNKKRHKKHLKQKIYGDIFRWTDYFALIKTFP